MQVPEFIAECLERWGGAVATRGPGLFDVLLPPELEQVFGRSLMAVAAGPTALRVEADAEVAAPGSPLVDQLIALASARGTSAFARLPAGRLRRGGMRQEVERTLLFSNCRVRHDATEPRVMDARYAQFNFRVTFLSDEKRERVVAIPVDLSSNRVNLALAERLADLAPAADDAPTAESTAVPAELAYASAQVALRTRVAQEAGLHRRRIEKRFGVEYARVVAYFDQMAEELNARRRDNAAGEADTLRKKLEAVVAERERKLHELGEKHQLRVRARLVSARLLVQAKTFFTVLVDRGSTTRRLTLCYDSLLERLELPACEACRRETTRVHVDADARMLCSACAGLG